MSFVTSFPKLLGLWGLLVVLALVGGFAMSAQGQGAQQQDQDAQQKGQGGQQVAWADNSTWQDTPPDALLGAWAVGGKCQDPISEKLIFVPGGYQWNRADGSWALARGKYSYSNGTSARVFFRLQRLEPSDGYDFVLTLYGSHLTKTNPLSGTTVEYKPCPDFSPS